jgi:hypothetical protein
MSLNPVPQTSFSASTETRRFVDTRRLAAGLSKIAASRPVHLRGQRQDDQFIQSLLSFNKVIEISFPFCLYN